MKLLSAKDYRLVPWKNGGGVTREVTACYPPEGTDFLWRVSIATVDGSGPFSHFAGIDRSIAVLDGGTMELTGAHGGVTLSARTQPYAFPGEWTIHATVGQATTDLNAMSRRGACAHRMERLRFDRHALLPVEAEGMVLVCNTAITVATPQQSLAASRFDTLVNIAPGTSLHLTAEGQGEVLMIRFFPESASGRPG